GRSMAVLLLGAMHAAFTGAALLGEAGVLLSAEPFSDELQIVDACLAAPERAARLIRERLRYRARSASRTTSGGM
ncbi:hypothetical protein ACFV0Q_30640, partial [Streptomyces sp. NPDC059564]